MLFCGRRPKRTCPRRTSTSLRQPSGSV
jgi:hypothetical protein